MDIEKTKRTPTEIWRTEEEADRQHQEDLRRLYALRPIDDDFMRCLFKDNIPLAELVLRNNGKRYLRQRRAALSH